MKKHIVLHPFLFSIYAVLSLFATNITQINISSLRTILYVAVGTIVLVTIIRLIVKDGLKAGLISSGVIILGFSYGHMSRLLHGWNIGGNAFNQEIFLALLWLILLAGWVYGVLKKWKNLGNISSYFNWVSFILILFPLYSLYTYQSQLNAVNPWKEKYIEETLQNSGVMNIQPSRSPIEDGKTRDIYYIILDAYTRADILQSYYGYDNSDFIKALEARGFYVASKSHANYTDTEFSLASSLNMVHIDDAPEYFYQNSGKHADWVISDVATMMIRRNRVGEFLHDQGYTFVAYDSGYVIAQAADADEFLHSPQIDENSGMQIMFEMMLLDTSIGRLYLDMRGQEFTPLQNLFDLHRKRILFTLETLPEFSAQPGNYFVYAHILSPHTPFVFGPNGEKLTTNDPFTLLDAHPGNPDNIPLYAGQVNYLNKLVLESIDQILANSDIPPIIIIQGDHSSKVFAGEEPDIQTRMQLHFPILNAYYLPGAPEDLIAPTISPVNTFRKIFNYYFGTDLKPMPDEGFYFTQVDEHADFVNVCQTYLYCNP